MTTTKVMRKLYNIILTKPVGLLLACCAVLAISACANQNYRKAEDLYQNGRYSDAYTYIEQALKDNPENEEYLKLEMKIRKGMYRKDFLGWDW